MPSHTSPMPVPSNSHPVLHGKEEPQTGLVGDTARSRRARFQSWLYPNSPGASGMSLGLLEPPCPHL